MKKRRQRLVKDSSTGLTVTKGPKETPPVTSERVREIIDAGSLAAVKQGLKESAEGKRVYRGSFAKDALKKPRKRTLLPEFKKLMTEKPSDDVQTALDEIRGDDPFVVMANSAPASFTPPDPARITNTHELADFAEAELAKTRTTHPLSPPKAYATWLDYAVATVSTRRLYHDYLWGHQPQWPAGLTRGDFEAAAEAELAQMRAQLLSHGQGGVR